MPSIRKLKSGRWQACVKAHPHKPVYRVFRTKSLAERWGMKTLEEMAMGEFNPINTSTLAQAVDRYLKNITPLKADSSLFREKSMGKIIKSLIGTLSLPHLTTDVLINLYVAPRLKSVSPDTVRRELSLLSQIFQSESYPNPIPSVRNRLFRTRKLSTPTPRDRRLTKTEECRLLKFCSLVNPELVSCTQLILLTGLRRAELLNTRKQTSYKNLKVQSGKTGHSRDIPITKYTKLLLTKLSKNIRNNEKIFSLHPDSLTHLFKKACDKAGIKDLRLHDLRGECGHRWIEKGIPIEFVAQLLGNSVTVCSKHYINNLNVDLIAKKL